MLVEGEIFRTCPDRPWGPPGLLYNRYRVFPGVKSVRRVTLTPHHLLVPWSRKSRAIPLLPLWAVRPVQCVSACKRVHFIFYTNTKCEYRSRYLRLDVLPIFYTVTLINQERYYEIPCFFSPIRFFFLSREVPTLRICQMKS